MCGSLGVEKYWRQEENPVEAAVSENVLLRETEVSLLPFLLPCGNVYKVGPPIQERG